MSWNKEVAKLREDSVNASLECLREYKASKAEVKLVKSQLDDRLDRLQKKHDALLSAFNDLMSLVVSKQVEVDYWTNPHTVQSVRSPIPVEVPSA